VVVSSVEFSEHFPDNKKKPGKKVLQKPDGIFSNFVQWVKRYKKPHEHREAIPSNFPQWVTGYKVPQEHYEAILSVFLQ